MNQNGPRHSPSKSKVIVSIVPFFGIVRNDVSDMLELFLWMWQASMIQPRKIVRKKAIAKYRNLKFLMIINIVPY